MVCCSLPCTHLRAQALGIATKINKGTIELVAEVHLIKVGEKVGASQATLLGKLGIKPFKYGLEILKVRGAGRAAGRGRATPVGQHRRWATQAGAGLR